jgi:hypothetical protein
MYVACGKDGNHAVAGRPFNETALYTRIARARPVGTAKRNDVAD